MPERQKVINGLERCHSYGMCDDEGCPYYHTVGCLELLRKDALELMKDQEPRILKPEEFAGTYYYCWLETKVSDERTICVISDICLADDGINYEARFVGTSEKGKLPHDWLGSHWRCWSAEPTDEQRQAVKW